VPVIVRKSVSENGSISCKLMSSTLSQEYEAQMLGYGNPILRNYDRTVQLKSGKKRKQIKSLLYCVD
jgi:hypothetical protein